MFAPCPLWFAIRVGYLYLKLLYNYVGILDLPLSRRNDCILTQFSHDQSYISLVTITIAIALTINIR
jgi:hypothetical protein